MSMNTGNSAYQQLMADGDFTQLKDKLSHEKGVTDPAALAASIGRKKYGEAGMEHKSEEAKKG